MNRRQFISMGGAALGAAVLARSANAQTHAGHGKQPGFFIPESKPAPAARVVAPGGQIAVHTPNGSTLPSRMVNGVKVMHLIANVFEHEFAPGLRTKCWGYNGGTPGPTIEAVEGDRLRIYVTNRLPEPTSVHWHGIVLPSGMDGVSGLNQKPILPGDTFMYEFTVDEPGTYMYHPHFDEMTQIALGMAGMLIVHPKRPRGPRVDRDFVLMTHEWKVNVGAERPDPNAMADFNVLTFNSKAFPATEPLLVGRGERVRIRLGNLSPMDHHPIHIHGLHFKITATDGGYIPESAQWPENTVLVPVGSTRVIEFEPPVSGDWAMHCHMTHHVMMQMGHGLPNMVGVDTSTIDRRMSRVMPEYMSMGATGMGGMGEMTMPMPKNSLPMRGGPGPYGYVDMGGMFTVVKVRDNPKPEDINGWYVPKKGEVADVAKAEQMRADGIDPERTS